MNVTFLAADTPLTKSFSRKSDGTLEKSSYPIVARFSSITEEVNDIAELHAAIIKHAEQGHCLLKGQLTHELRDESRAGSTSGLTPTEWVCFDFDNVEGILDAESAIRMILPQFNDVSYVMQYSASSGISGEAGLRAHLFFMLNEPLLPDAAKLWVTQLNLENPILCKNLALSSNGLTLKFTLDRTVNQNDKLIYIAPPTLSGDIDDPLVGRRIQLVNKTKSRGTFPTASLWSAARATTECQAIVTRMRAEQGLKKLAPKYKLLNNEEILTNPEKSNVTGEKADRQWVRINVQGESASWAYYYDADNPQILRNFKGQPSVLLKDFLPEYYIEVMSRLEARRLEANKTVEIRPFVFRDRSADAFYNGVFDMVNAKLLDVSQTRGDARRLQFFFGQYGQQPPSIIEDWTYEFRPYDTRLIDFEGRFLNRWTPSQLLIAPPASDEVPPMIKLILMHVLGNDEQCYDHFINWLACLFQYRRKMLTAWVLHGIEGTGKGTLFSRILVPIFGKQHTVEKLTSQFEEKFNADLELALVCVLDETKADGGKNQNALMSKLKSYITEPQMSIRAMQRNAKMVDSFVSFILFSNQLDAVELSSTDRRFNVAFRQEKRLLDALAEHLGRAPTQSDFDYLEHTETPLFAGYLAKYKANLDRASRALENDPKAHMRLASMDALQQAVDAIKRGDLELFTTYLEDGTADPNDPHSLQAYSNVVKQWVDNIGLTTVVSTAEIRTVYQYMFAPNSPIGPHKFSKLLAHKQVDTKTRYYDQRDHEMHRGIQTVWKLDEVSRAAFRKQFVKSAPVVEAKAAPLRVA